MRPEVLFYARSVDLHQIGVHTAASYLHQNSVKISSEVLFYARSVDLHQIDVHTAASYLHRNSVKIPEVLFYARSVDLHKSQPRSQGFSLFVIGKAGKGPGTGRSHDFQHPDIVGAEEGGSSSQHALQLINIHNHDFSQC